MRNFHAKKASNVSSTSGRASKPKPITLPQALQALSKVAPKIPLRDAITIGAGFLDLCRKGHAVGGDGFPLARIAVACLYSPEEQRDLLAKLGGEPEKKPQPGLAKLGSDPGAAK